MKTKTIAERRERARRLAMSNCVHEAGHAVLFLHYKVPVRWIVIGEGMGNGHVTPGNWNPPMDWFKHAQANWTTFAAGPLAEELYRQGDDFEEEDLEWVLVRLPGDALWNGWGKDFRGIRRIEKEWFPHWTPELTKELMARTYKILTDNWDLVLRIAQALYDKAMKTPHPEWDWSTGKIKMTGAEIQSLMTKAVAV